MRTVQTRRRSAICCIILLWILSCQDSLSFSTGSHHSLTCIQTNVPSRRRSRVRLNVEEGSDDEDEYYDEDDYDDEEEDQQQVDYGKFERESKMHQEEEGSPLPGFLSDSDDSSAERTSSSWPPSASSTAEPMMADETQRRMEEQQRQIDKLMKLVQQQQQSQTPNASISPPVETTTASEEVSSATTAPPVKAMLFIDGTWLYYSIHERNEERCPILRKYGRGWQARYRFDWAALPRVISEQLQLQHTWDSSPVEISRASVYTSVKKDTSRYSNRIRMFEDMKAANYDVFIMETVGPGEKCVDIQLAVEMLHYATVPNAYDVAILLSGDKDFLPALLRTRQKGRKVGIVSMRTGCNRALFETPNVKDYNVVWIEDFLDQLMIPLRADSAEKPIVSAFTLSKVIYDFICESNLPRVSSRDIGRYLKQVQVNDQSLLDELKRLYGGLHQFLSVSGCFKVLKRSARDELRKTDPSDKTFWAEVHENAERLLLEEAKRTHFTPEEKEFFDDYSLERLNNDEQAYFHSREMPSDDDVNGDIPMELPEELTRDYSRCKVAELKEICRERGLTVSGTKAVLIERIQDDVNEKIQELEQQHRARARIKRPRMTGRINGENAPNQRSSFRSSRSYEYTPNADTQEYLEGLVREYIQARGGQASSRDIGRYLAANGDSGQSDTSSRGTALSELKSLYGGLASFIANRRDSFEKLEDDPTTYEFQVALRQ